jgi:hypothetical protein
MTLEVGNLIAFMTYAMQILISFMMLSAIFIMVPTKPSDCYVCTAHDQCHHRHHQCDDRIHFDVFCCSIIQKHAKEN